MLIDNFRLHSHRCFHRIIHHQETPPMALPLQWEKKHWAIQIDSGTIIYWNFCRVWSSTWRRPLISTWLEQFVCGLIFTPWKISNWPLISNVDFFNGLFWRFFLHFCIFWVDSCSQTVISILFKTCTPCVWQNVSLTPAFLFSFPFITCTPCVWQNVSHALAFFFFLII